MIRDPQREHRRRGRPDEPAGNLSDFTLCAAQRRNSLPAGWLPGIRSSGTFSARCRRLRSHSDPCLPALMRPSRSRRIRRSTLVPDNDQLIYAELRNVAAELKP